MTANSDATRFASLIVKAALSEGFPFQIVVTLSMKVLNGNFVAGSLIPRSPNVVLEVMGGPNREDSGLITSLVVGPRGFHASMATDLTASRLTEGITVLSNRSATGVESALLEPMMALATSLILARGLENWT